MLMVAKSIAVSVVDFTTINIKALNAYHKRATMNSFSHSRTTDMSCH